MRGRPAVAIIGAGNLANALAKSLHAAGYRIEAVVAPGTAASQSKARRLANKVGARAVTELPANVSAQVIWFCVPDGEIRNAAQSAARSIDWTGRIAFHLSGALTSEELNILSRGGAAVASVHPLMTFVHRSQPSLDNIPFAIEGDLRAVRVARQFVKDLGGRAYAIRKEDKAAYHAWGTFISPLFTSLLATAEQVARKAGVPGKEARRRAIPILRQTLENYAVLGSAGGFSGPIIRGDVATVERHWRVLRQVPAAQEVYRALILAALQYLPAKNRTQLRRAVRG